MQPELGRGYVQRVKAARLGGRELVLLDVRVPGETLSVVCAAGPGVGLVTRELRARLVDAMRATGPVPSQARWRSRLEGAQVERVEVRAIELSRAGVAFQIQATKVDIVLVAAGDAGASVGGSTDRATLEQRGVELVTQIAHAETDGRHVALRRAITKALQRIERRIAAVRGDLAQTEGADAMAQRAQLFVAAAATALRGVTELTATDWSSGEARVVNLPIDPARGAKEQIEALFKRARRLKAGAKIARTRLRESEAALAKLKEAAASLAGPAVNLESVEAIARAAAPRDFVLARASKGPAGVVATAERRRQPYRTFTGASGARILVGRGATHNDALTFHVARPHDLWLHAKNRHGAHVIVPLDKEASCPAGLLVEAAHLAVHFSDARDEAIVEVQYTPRRYLRKPRGSAPGLVVVDREKVIVLRKDDAELRRLLESEMLVGG